MKKQNCNSVMCFFDKHLKERAKASIKDGLLDVAYLLGITDKVDVSGTTNPTINRKLKEVLRCSKDKYIDGNKYPSNRLREVEVTYKENNEVMELHFNGWAFELAYVLGKRFPKALITAANYDVVKEKPEVIEEKISKHLKGLTGYTDEYVEEVKEAVTYKNIRANLCVRGNKMTYVNVYDLGMEFAYKSEYEYAINLLKIMCIGKDKHALCNTGVCYERLHDYHIAAKYYNKSDEFIAKENLLNLYKRKYIKFNKDSYVDTCYELIAKGSYLGYWNLSIMFSDGLGVEVNYDTAIDYIERGIRNFGPNDAMDFELAYLLDTREKSKADLERSHILYKRLQYCNEDAESKAITLHNLGVQYLYGRGCNKNVRNAIKAFERSKDLNYLPAIERLIGIYKNEKGFINAEKEKEYTELWKRIKAHKQ